MVQQQATCKTLSSDWLPAPPLPQVSRSLGCGSCGSEEYCGFSSGHPLCEKCTVCPAGFFMVAQCSLHADRICQVSPPTVG